MKKDLHNSNKCCTFEIPNQINKMKNSKITPAQIRSAKLQDMTPQAFVSGLSALAESIKRGKGLVK